MSHKKQSSSLATYVQKTLMQFLPAMNGNNSSSSSRSKKTTQHESHSSSSSATGGGNSKSPAKSKHPSHSKSKSPSPSATKKTTAASSSVTKSKSSASNSSSSRSPSSAHNKKQSTSSATKTKSKSSSSSKVQKASHTESKHRESDSEEDEENDDEESEDAEEESEDEEDEDDENEEEDVVSEEEMEVEEEEEESKSNGGRSARSPPSSSSKSKPKPSNKRKRSPSSKKSSSSSKSSTSESESNSDDESESSSPSRSSSSSSSSSSSAPAPASASRVRHAADDDVDIESDRRQPSKIKYIDLVQVGNYELTTWYHSPYPDQYRTCKKIYLCPYCLKYCKEYKSLEAHSKECTRSKPPGKLIYQQGRHSVFEVDGAQHKLYCQCLCLFAKLFIDHKTLYYDVDPFLFYVMTESTPATTTTSTSTHHSPKAPAAASSSASPSSSSSPPMNHNIVAYFSKEKQSPDQFNLSCILTFPQYQRHGYGKFLIALSYELSRREKRLGSPEKPLSELGRVSYRSYWVSEILTLFVNEPRTQSLSILDLCTRTSIKKEDVISSLESIGLITYDDENDEHSLACQSKHGREVIAVHKQKLAKYKQNGTVGAASSSASPPSGPIEFRPSVLQWSPPPGSLLTQTSPSVAFPATPPSDRGKKDQDERKAHSSQSHAKKKIKY